MSTNGNGLGVRIAKNVSYALIANIVSMVIGAAGVLVYPRFMGVADYGYYQLFLFFTFYTVLFSFGISEGVFLEHGGERYEDSDKQSLGSQFFWLNIIELVIFFVLGALIVIFKLGDNVQRNVYLLDCGAALIVNARYFLMNLAQATNQIKDYCIVVIVERVLAFLGGVFFISIGYGSFLTVIGADIFGRLVSLIYIGSKMPDLFKGGHDTLSKTLSYSGSTLKAGMKLMTATYISSLVIGASRYMIQGHWDIVVFAKVSFVISIANMLVRCVNSAGQALYPIMKGESKESMVSAYSIIAALLDLCVFISYAIYPLLQWLLGLWVPAYKDALQFAVLVLPIALFESKNALLVTTYFKAFRKEGQLLLFNIAAFVASTLGSVVAIYLLDDVRDALLVITVVLAARCVISEVYLSQLLPIKVSQMIPWEVGVSALFVVLSYSLGNTFASIAMVALCVVFVVVSRNTFQTIMAKMRGVLAHAR